MNSATRGGSVRGDDGFTVKVLVAGAGAGAGTAAESMGQPEGRSTCCSPQELLVEEEAAAVDGIVNDVDLNRTHIQCT